MIIRNYTRPRKRLPLFLVFGMLLTVLSLPLESLAESRSWPAWRADTADGREFHSKQLEGKVVVIAMWASWCPSCRKQIPILNTLQQMYESKSVQVLSFSFDHSDSTHKSFVKEQDFGFPSIFARNGEGLKVVKLLQRAAGTLEAVPTVLIYDKHGQLAHRMVGFFSRKELEDLVDPLLDKD